MRSGQENVLPHTRGCLPHTHGVIELPNSILHQVLCRADLCAGTVPMSGDDVYLVLGTALWGGIGDLVASADVGALSICNSEVQFQESMHGLIVCDICISLIVLMSCLLTFHVRDQNTFYRGLLMDSILHHLVRPTVSTQQQQV